MAFGALVATTVHADGFDFAGSSTDTRMTYHRAVDAAVWAMPLMNFKFLPGCPGARRCRPK